MESLLFEGHEIVGEFFINWIERRGDQRLVSVIAAVGV
jgi:hypothetical protein